MSGPWVRLPPEGRDQATALMAAAAVAAGVGLVTFYLTWLLLAREEVSEAGPPGRDEAGARGGGGA